MLCVQGAAGGSLNSSMSHGLAQSGVVLRRRPGSLVIGATQMSKSSSEPMNLITDMADDSPDTGLFHRPFCWSVSLPPPFVGLFYRPLCPTLSSSWRVFRASYTASFADSYHHVYNYIV